MRIDGFEAAVIAAHEQHKLVGAHFVGDHRDQLMDVVHRDGARDARADRSQTLVAAYRKLRERFGAHLATQAPAQELLADPWRNVRPWRPRLCEEVALAVSDVEVRQHAQLLLRLDPFSHHLRARAPAEAHE